MEHKIMVVSAAPLKLSLPLLLRLLHYKIPDEDSSLLMNCIPGCGFAGVKEKHQVDMEAGGTLILVFRSLKGEGGSGNRNMFYFRKICVKQTRTRILQSPSLHEETIKLRHLLYSSSHHAGSLQRWPPLFSSFRLNQTEFALLFSPLYSPGVYLWL